VDEVVLKTVAVILKSFGLQEEDTTEIRLDFQHLRRWRKATKQIERPWSSVKVRGFSSLCFSVTPLACSHN
jgi:hypothetical protein